MSRARNRDQRIKQRRSVNRIAQSQIERLEERNLFAGLADPVAADDHFEAMEDQVLVGNVIANDASVGNLPLVIETVNGDVDAVGKSIELDSGATLTVQPDGTFTLDPGTSDSIQQLETGEEIFESFEYKVGLGFTGFYSFGDSLSDLGNLAQITGGVFPPDPPYFGGRSSGGLMWPDFLGSRAVMDPLAGNLAVYGGTTGRDNFNNALLGRDDLPGMLDQLDQFLIAQAGQPADPNALYVVWGGPNDFIIDPTADPVQVVTSAVTNIATIVGTLRAVGAQHIVVPNMPDLGATPFGQSLGIGPQLSQLTDAFNSALFGTLTQLNLGATLFDVNSSFENIASNAESLGITELNEPCFNQSTFALCSNPDEYFFYDSIHPTARVHELLAEDLFDTLLQTQPLAHSDTATATVDIGGATTAPTVSIDGPDVGVRGFDYTFTFSATDPSASDQAALFTYQVDWNADGVIDEEAIGPASGIELQHTLERGKRAVIKASVVDRDGDSSSLQLHRMRLVDALVEDGNLHVGGTPKSDSIIVRPYGDKLIAVVNGRISGPFSVSDDADVVVVGLAGNDYIHMPAVNNDSTIDAGAGHDAVTAGSGNDLIIGGLGNDILFGGAGDDEMHGNEGHDLLYGQLGDDQMFGNSGNDWLLGGFGNDTATGDAGEDWLYGNDGDDELDGGDDFDFLFGGPGTDVLLNGEVTVS